MIIIALLIGLFIGCSVSIFLIALKIANSNDFGNDKGNFNDFSDSALHVIQKQDKIKRP